MAKFDQIWPLITTAKFDWIYGQIKWPYTHDLISEQYSWLQLRCLDNLAPKQSSVQLFSTLSVSPPIRYNVPQHVQYQCDLLVETYRHM